MACAFRGFRKVIAFTCEASKVVGAKKWLSIQPTFHELTMENYEREILLFISDKIFSVLQTQFGDYMV